MNNYKESPFQYLRRKKVEGQIETEFTPETIDNWYKARAYVLDKLKDVAYTPGSSEHLHAVILGDTPLMLSVARQVALSAHFINYNEDNEDESQRNRTVITIVSQDETIEQTLIKEEYLGNLPKYCKTVIYGVEKNKDSYIDIELHVVKEWNAGVEKCCKEINEKEVETFCGSNSSNTIDTRKAVLASRAYDLGALISNVPYEDIHDASRYTQALDAFQYDQLEKPWHRLVDEKIQGDLTRVKEALSNVFCSDCFETRDREIRKCYGNDLKNYKKYWEKYNDALSKSEHARWVVEKLIMGYRPLTLQERIKDERFFISKEKKQFRKQLKKNQTDPAHIDICSYSDLRRIDPDSLKYDSFLMLAIPDILKKVNGNAKR